MRSNRSGFVHIILVLIVAFVLAGVVAYVVANRDSIGGSSLGDKPSETSLLSFEWQEIGYECSQKIDGDWAETTGQTGQPKWTFVPKSPSRVSKYCRTTYAIEYHAALDILKRQDVSEVIDRYDSTLAWVKVLNYELIEDKDYIARILPAYADVNVHCIVVVHSPEGERFFLENGDKDHDYIEIEPEEFLASLNRASDADVNAFWLNLR